MRPEPARVYIVDPGSWEDGSGLERYQELQPGDVLRIYGGVTRIEFEAAEQWREPHNPPDPRNEQSPRPA